MKIKRYSISGIVSVVPDRLSDERGFFCESWNAKRMREHELDFEWVQDNHSFSAKAGTLRGLHYQSPPRAQDKLVRCTRGAIIDIAVDARMGSPTYGQWVREELSAENGKQLLVPKGFLHGFVTLVPDTEVQYKVTDFYDAECDGSVRWNSLGIDWGLEDSPILSAKDLNAPPFDSWVSPFECEKLT